MMQRIALLGQGQRILIFILMMVGGLLFIGAITVFLILSSVNAVGRTQAIPLNEGVTTAEFVVLPDEDAYPAAVTVNSAGTVYTGSYVSGVIWAINAAGELEEVPHSRDTFGSIVGLAAASDDVLYVLDRITGDPRAAGGLIWRLEVGQAPVEFAKIEGESGFIAPIGLTLDAEGRVYALDRGRREVWRWNADGSGAMIFWQPIDEGQLPTGMDYDAQSDALIIADSEMNTVYSVPVGGGVDTQLFRYESAINKPSFYGVAVDEGRIYLTALEQNSIATLQDGQLVYLAAQFRGPSDIVAAGNGRFYVTNFDSSALVVPGVTPRLPFALDVVTIGELVPPIAENNG